MIELCTNMSVHGESDHNSKKLHNKQYVILCKRNKFATTVLYVKHQITHRHLKHKNQKKKKILQGSNCRKKKNESKVPKQ